MSDRLEQFVLDYFTQHEALIERPAFGLVEVLLPDAEANRLHADPLLTLTFLEEAAAPNATPLTIGHPLIEAMIEAARSEGQVTCWYINEVRHTKAGFFDLVKREWTFANGWLTAIKGVLEEPQLHYYAWFNFKVAFVSDEKQEEVVSLLMDVNRGVPVPRVEADLGRLPLSPESHLYELPDAPLAWAPHLGALSEEGLQLLLPKATQGLVAKLTPRLAGLQKRNARLLELDLARLNEFYDETEGDLEKRLRTAQDEARAETLRTKLAFAQADRRHKLADVQEKHRLRLSVDLLNVALLAQPKLSLPILVENRYSKRQQAFVWDPLLHQLEPPLCDVCQQPFARLHLCTNGHLMCDDDTLYCDLCKREFCRHCASSLGHCATCGRVVCTHSQIKCKLCGAIVCADHQQHPHGLSQ